MTLEEIDKELDLYLIYQKIYIEILTIELSTHLRYIHKNQTGEQINNSYNIPSFNYFKKTLNDDRYSLLFPNFIEGYIIDDNRIVKKLNHNANINNCAFYRFIKFWRGKQFYINDFQVNSLYLQNKLQS